MIKAVIFDLDGTLLYTIKDLYLSVNKALEKFGYPLRTIEEVTAFVGNGIRNLMEQACPQGIADFEECLKYFKEYYSKHSEDNTVPYDGIMDMLKHFNEIGVKCAIVSNKFDGATKQLSEKNFGSLISVAVGEREGIRKKPAPDTVFEVLKLLGITPEEAVFVGDSDTDVETAENAGMPCISVTWGYRSREFLAERGATFFADTTKDIIDYVNKKA
jgi:phosphoglycolate phosphatase